MKALICIGALSLSLLVTQAPAGVSLIVNGGFESGNLASPGSYTSLPSGSTDLTGWEIGGVDVDYIGQYWQASEGSRSLDLNGDHGAGTISQTFATQVGRTYDVVFDMAGNPDGYHVSGVDPIKSLRVSVSGDGEVFDAADFDFDTTETGRFDMGWQQQTWSFVALGDLTTLTFASLETDLADNGYGAALDNVAVFERIEQDLYREITTVPVPGAVMLVGIGLAGVLGYRTKH